MKRPTPKPVPQESGVHAALGLLPALVAVILYTATASLVPVPGESARLLYHYSGLDPFPPLLHPLWGAAMNVMCRIGSNAAFSASIFSALCGTFTVYLVYRLMTGARIRYLRTNEAPDTGRFCGLASAFYLMGSVPFWTISTRAHPASLHLLMLTLTLVFLTRLRRNGDGLSLAVFCFLLGLGIAEYPAMLLLAPPLAVVAGLHAYRSKKIRTKQVAAGLAALAAGLSLNALAAWQFMTHPAQAYLGGYTFGEAFASLLHEQVKQLLQVSGEVGWLLIAMFAVIPWLLAFLAAQQTPVTEEPKGSTLVYGLLTLMAAAQLIPSRFTPFLAFQERGILLATPYLLVAAYFGYAMAYWYARIAIEARNVRKTGPDPAWWLALPCIGLLAVAASLNFPWIDTRPAGVIYRWVQQVSRIVPDNSWLVTNGHIDDLFALASRDAGSNQRTFNLGKAGEEPYRLYLAAQLPSKRLQQVARASLGACLAEWLQTEDVDSIAILDSPEPWKRARLGALPHLGLYRGIESVETLARRRLLEDHRSFWNTVLKELGQVQYRSDFTGQLAERLLRHSAKVANDYGLLMDELGEAGIALEAYQAALTADPINSSALFNRFDLLAHLGQPEESQRLWDRLVKTLPALQPPGAMELAVDRYGQLRHPQWARSLVWALGSDDTAPVPPDRVAAVAAAYAAGNLSLAGPLVTQLAADFPQSVHAGTLRGVLAYLQGAEQEVEEVITTMDRASLDWAPLPHILGHFAEAKDRDRDSRQFWQRALTRRPADIALLEDLVGLQLRDPDAIEPDEADKYLTRLLTLDPENSLANYAAGRNHFANGRLDAAADAFQRSMRRGNVLDVQFRLAATLQQQGRSAEALPLARRALDLDPTHADSKALLSQVLSSVGSDVKLPEMLVAQAAPSRRPAPAETPPPEPEEIVAIPEGQTALPPPRLMEDTLAEETVASTAAPPPSVPAPQPEETPAPAAPATPVEESPAPAPAEATQPPAEPPLAETPPLQAVPPQTPTVAEKPAPPPEATAKRPLDW